MTIGHATEAKDKLGEREARSIIIQMLRGLLYLNIGDSGSSTGGDAAVQATPKVIHYDLKPGNILFDKAGQVKLPTLDSQRFLTRALVKVRWS